jgi:hypothetical protein
VGRTGISSQCSAYYVGLPFTDSASDLWSQLTTNLRNAVANHHETDIICKGRKVQYRYPQQQRKAGGSQQQGLITPALEAIHHSYRPGEHITPSVQMAAGQATQIPEDGLRDIASQSNSSSTNDQRQFLHLLLKATKVDTHKRDESRRSVHNTTKYTPKTKSLTKAGHTRRRNRRLQQRRTEE